MESRNASPWITVLAVCALHAVVVACDRQQEPLAADSLAADPPRASQTSEPMGFRLVEVASDLGLDVDATSDTRGSYPMPAIMGGGAAVFDADGDDDLDLFLVGSRPGRGSDSLGHRLFLQEEGVFVDRTRAFGVNPRRTAADAIDSWGMGAAVGDIDNDGDLDLFVSHQGPDLLLRNDGGGFSDVSAAAGTADPQWSTSAVFCDYDRDGWLDLFVARYVRWEPERRCTIEGGRLDYCGPAQFAGWSDRLYRNRGQGRFEDVSSSSGIAAFEDRGLGVVCADLDDDGWVDFYVANDSDPNHLWINRRDGTFSEEGMLSGAAFNRYGVGEAGMGVVAGDADGDGDLDLFVSHLVEETNTLYQNRGVDGFEDLTASVGLGVTSVPFTGFGTAFVDFELDGDLDLVVANGAVKRRQSALGLRPEWFWNAYAEPNMLFLNRGDGHFRDRSADAGDFGAPVEVSRALVPADLDRDGAVDLVVTQIEGPLQVFRNQLETGSDRGWLWIRVLDPALKREAVGARVTIRADEKQWVRHAVPFGGYLTRAPSDIHLGLGVIRAVDGFEVRWPDGSEEAFEGVERNRWVELERGRGNPVSRSSPQS